MTSRTERDDARRGRAITLRGDGAVRRHPEAEAWTTAVRDVPAGEGHPVGGHVRDSEPVLLVVARVRVADQELVQRAHGDVGLGQLPAVGAYGREVHQLEAAPADVRVRRTRE